MNTEYEKLLLSPEQLENELHDHFDAMNCGLSPEQNEYIIPVMVVAAKAQHLKTLDGIMFALKETVDCEQAEKLFNEVAKKVRSRTFGGEWLDKPDSEGLWFNITKDGILSLEQTFDNGTSLTLAWWHVGTSEWIPSYSSTMHEQVGRWRKVIVPIVPNPPEKE